MVTRTIKSTEMILLCVDLETQETCNRSVCISGVHTGNEKGIMKLISEQLPETVKPVTVIKEDVTEALYGMNETDFIRLADVIPNRYTVLDNKD